jgi:hypothetical protein
MTHRHIEAQDLTGDEESVPRFLRNRTAWEQKSGAVSGSRLLTTLLRRSGPNNQTDALILQQAKAAPLQTSHAR